MRREQRREKREEDVLARIDLSREDYKPMTRLPDELSDFTKAKVAANEKAQADLDRGRPLADVMEQNLRDAAAAAKIAEREVKP
jgi:hypothetical protein